MTMMQALCAHVWMKGMAGAGVHDGGRHVCGSVKQMMGSRLNCIVACLRSGCFEVIVPHTLKENHLV
jgi:hypothetical protein